MKRDIGKRKRLRWRGWRLGIDCGGHFIVCLSRFDQLQQKVAKHFPGQSACTIVNWDQQQEKPRLHIHLHCIICKIFGSYICKPSAWEMRIGERKLFFFQISNVDGQRPGWPGGRRSSRNLWSKSRPRYITSSIFLIELCKISWNILTALVLFVTERRLYTQPYISQPHLCLLHRSYPHPHLSLCQ